MRNEANWEPAVSVTGVRLTREGDYAVVSVEINKTWVPVIREHYDGNYSHIVEPSGIRACAEGKR